MEGVTQCDLTPPAPTPLKNHNFVPSFTLNGDATCHMRNKFNYDGYKKKKKGLLFTYIHILLNMVNASWIASTSFSSII